MNFLPFRAFTLCSKPRSRAFSHYWNHNSCHPSFAGPIFLSESMKNHKSLFFIAHVAFVYLNRKKCSFNKCCKFIYSDKIARYFSPSQYSVSSICQLQMVSICHATRVAVNISVHTEKK